MAKKEIIKNAALTVRVNEEPIVDALESVKDAVVETTGATYDVAEDAVEAVVSAYRTNPYIIVGVAVVAASTGAYLGYRYGVKKAGLRFDERLEGELVAMEDHYKRLAKVPPYDTIESAAKEVLPPETQAVLETYQGGDGTEMVVELQGPLQISEQRRQERAAEAAERLRKGARPEVAEEVRTNVFANNSNLPTWDAAYELTLRAELPDGYPYVITAEEYNSNESDYNQEQLTYFAGDDTLVDSKDIPVDNAEQLVGDDNLERFGHGSGDSNIVYIRNDNLSIDMEVVRSDFSFSKAVHGFDPEVGRSLSRAPRRMRSADE